MAKLDLQGQGPGTGDEAVDVARLIHDAASVEAALRFLNAHLEQRAKRIAHALHDEAGQLLASVYLKVAEIADELPPEWRRRVEELRTLLDQVDDQVRRLAHELRPLVLDDLGLVPACRQLADGVSRRSRLRVSVEGSTGGRLPAEVETALYRVVQEALTNVSRHAQATSAGVVFQRFDGLVRGRVTDDGRGFDVEAALGSGRLGLAGMRERLVAVGGWLTIQSAPARGTTIGFEVPVEG